MRFLEEFTRYTALRNLACGLGTKFPKCALPQFQCEELGTEIFSLAFTGTVQLRPDTSASSLFPSCVYLVVVCIL